MKSSLWVTPSPYGNRAAIGSFKGLIVAGPAQAVATPGAGQIALPATGQITAGTSGNSSITFAAASTSFSVNSAAAGVKYAFYDSNGVQLFGVIEQTGGANGGIATKPVASQAPTGGNVAFGTAWQNTNAWDVTLQLVLSITANTSLVVSLGVGPTNTPGQQTLITGVTQTGLVPITVKVPAGYYALLSESGTGTIAIIGQQQFNN